MLSLPTCRQATLRLVPSVAARIDHARLLEHVSRLSSKPACACAETYLLEFCRTQILQVLHNPDLLAIADAESKQPQCLLELLLCLCVHTLSKLGRALVLPELGLHGSIVRGALPQSLRV